MNNPFALKYLALLGLVVSTVAAVANMYRESYGWLVLDVACIAIQIHCHLESLVEIKRYYAEAAI